MRKNKSEFLKSESVRTSYILIILLLVSSVVLSFSVSSAPCVPQTQIQVNDCFDESGTIRGTVENIYYSHETGLLQITLQEWDADVAVDYEFFNVTMKDYNRLNKFYEDGGTQVIITYVEDCDSVDNTCRCYIVHMQYDDFAFPYVILIIGILIGFLSCFVILVMF